MSKCIHFLFLRMVNSIGSHIARDIKVNFPKEILFTIIIIMQVTSLCILQCYAVPNLEQISNFESLTSVLITASLSMTEKLS